jgi:hypothetical protein
MTDGKPWYLSKTIWVNALALAGSLAVAYGFAPERWAEISTTALAVINVALRIITGEPLTLTASTTEEPK